MIFSRAKHAPTSGPWHLLFPLPGTLHEIAPGSLPHHFLSLLKVHLINESFSDLSRKIALPLETPTPLPALFLSHIHHQLTFYAFIYLPYLDLVVSTLRQEILQQGNQTLGIERQEIV